MYVYFFVLGGGGGGGQLGEEMWEEWGGGMEGFIPPIISQRLWVLAD